MRNPPSSILYGRRLLETVAYYFWRARARFAPRLGQSAQRGSHSTHVSRRPETRMYSSYTNHNHVFTPAWPARVKMVVLGNVVLRIVYRAVCADRPRTPNTCMVVKGYPDDRHRTQIDHTCLPELTEQGFMIYTPYVLKVRYLKIYFHWGKRYLMQSREYSRKPK
jgi:hypothetical protein